MKTFDDMLSRQLQDEEFKKEYEAIHIAFINLDFEFLILLLSFL